MELPTNQCTDHRREIEIRGTYLCVSCITRYLLLDEREPHGSRTMFLISHGKNWKTNLKVCGITSSFFGYLKEGKRQCYVPDAAIFNVNPYRQEKHGKLETNHCFHTDCVIRFYDCLMLVS